MTRYTANIITKSPATPTGPTTTGRAPGIWRMDDVAYWTKQGLWPNANISAPDTYFPYVSLLLSTTSLGNANNNLFVDSSGAFNPVSRNGNTTQGSFTPYSTNWSNYFDGSGDYLQMPSNAAFAFGTGDYTIEGWIYVTVGGLNQRITWFSDDRHNIDLNTSNQIFLYDGAIRTFGTVTVGTWNHFAVSRSGGTVSCYLNGVRGYNASETTNSSNRSMNIAANNAGNGYFNGYISNIRVVKGVGIYSGATITVPTFPLTAISGTSLLTCQSNRFRDASSNNFTITPNGDTRVTDFSPFSPAYPGASYNQSDITNWSGYFDGSGDYLSAPSNAAFAFGTGDFTLECWAYLDGNPGVIAGIFDTRNSSSSSGGILCQIDQDFSNALRVEIGGSQVFLTSQTVPLKQWNHIAIVRSSGTVKAYLNGSAMTGGSAANSTNITDTNMRWGGDRYGYYVYGYISNARVVKGTAVYTAAFTPPTTNLTAISGTSLLTLQNAAFTDNSTNNFVITPSGNVTVTGNSPFNTTGYWSNYFDGSSTVTFSQINMAGDFTIEGWVYFIGTNNPTVLGANPPNHQSLRRLSTAKHYFYREGVDITGTIDVPLNQWVHLAATRSSGTVRIFTNGVLDGSRTITGTFSLFCLGGVDTVNDRLTGYTSNMRVVDGTAIYTATFTPPTAPLTAVSGTVLLTSQNGTFKDNSTNNRTLTRNGSPTVQSFDPFYTATIASNGGSMYFDGSGDYLAVPSAPNMNFGTGNWTIECWVYVSTRTTNYPLIFGNNRGSWTTDALALTVSNADSASYNDKFVFAWNNGGFSSPSAGTSQLLVANVTNSTGTWYHFAVVRDSSTSIKMFRNGTQVANATISSAATFNWGYNGSLVGGGNWDGANGYFNGYISNLRATPSAVYTAAFTPPTAPLTPSGSTTLLINGMNAGIYDATAINDMETVGNAQVSTVQSKFSGSSMYFDGSGDYLVSRGNTILLGTGNFTVEFWVYFNAVNNGTVKYLYDFRTASATSASFLAQESSNDWTYWNGAGSSVTTGLSGSTFATGQWYHVAITRSSNVLYCFVNGTKVSSNPADSSNYASATMTLGARYSGSDGLNGYIDDVRLTAGVARYTANFTPPTQAFSAF